MKILLAVDGSECSNAAVEQVASRPWPAGSQIRVVNSFELPLTSSPEGWVLPALYFTELDNAVRANSETIVMAAVATLKSKVPKDTAIDSKSVPGAPRSVILDEAKAFNADLIVVGSHGYRAWERFLLGSVSQSVVSHAQCSVEVVRCKKAVVAYQPKPLKSKVG